jgi:DNA modification methylase
MSVLLVQADARHLPLADRSVQCVVTSPPYWGLRDYGIAGQLGLEKAVGEYVSALVEVFTGVRRVLKDDGICWLNLGDSYAGGGNYRGINSENSLSDKQRSNRGATGVCQALGALGKDAGGAKPKDLVGVPWRVAFALQADGWYLRSDVIWSKPNPMPESVTDRPTKAHEYLFLLAKSERYYYNADAIAEPVSAAMMLEMEQGYGGLGLKDYEAAGVQNPSSVKARIIANALARVTGRGVGKEGERQPDGRQPQRSNSGGYPSGLTRNKRTVWQIPTQPVALAHFATMPEALIEPCILAGSRNGDVILDPFVGSGTVARVAVRLGRRAVGCDLNAAYLTLAQQRTTGITYGLPLETDGDAA